MSEEQKTRHIITEKFVAEGTTCDSCAEIIKRQALKVDGVKSAEFDFSTEKGHVTYDKNKTSLDEILFKIEEKGYKCYTLRKEHEEKNTTNIFGWAAGILGILMLGYFLFGFIDTIQLPQISQDMGYGLLFILGLLTGFHCIAMCGGFVVSYTAKDAQEGRKSYKSHIMYGLGKTVSYTVIGAAFGLLGSIIAFTPTMRGVAGIIAGIFLVLFGLKMLNIIPALRKFSITTPAFISKFAGEKSKHAGPLVIGLLNGLMIACGPLQAVYILAAGTGSAIEGAKLLFVFAIGTLPVMLGFGYLTTIISSKITHKILKFSGAVVIILGIIMLNNGLTLTGTGYDIGSIAKQAQTSTQNANTNQAPTGSGVAIMKDGYQEIRMDVDASGWTPDKFILQKGVPVKWIINVKQLTGCNKAIQVPKLGLKFDLKQGEQTIEFTPNEAGTISWSCWMGMIPGTFIVKDNLDRLTGQAIQQELDQVKQPAKGSCGCGGAK